MQFFRGTAQASLEPHIKSLCGGWVVGGSLCYDGGGVADTARSLILNSRRFFYVFPVPIFVITS
jgi:hypothetical protein